MIKGGGGSTVVKLGFPVQNAFLIVKHRADDVSSSPSGVASVCFDKAVGTAGNLKSSEYLLLAGPIGKYLLERCLSAVQAAVFEYLHLIGLLCQKTISCQKLDQLEQRICVVLTQLEILLLSWELSMNKLVHVLYLVKHNMLHLAQAVRANGPCWAWSMFGFERFWWHLRTWMSQYLHPAAVIFNAHIDFKAAFLALPVIDDAELDGERDTAAAQNEQSSDCLYHKLTSFYCATNELLLSPNLQAGSSSTCMTIKVPLHLG